MNTVAVITSTIGRPELRQCIESVRAQGVGAKHFVYVNGPKYHDAARSILSECPDVAAFYLPEETGSYWTGELAEAIIPMIGGKAGGGSMADVFAAGPFLTRADWIFYLDDDNWYEPDHVASVLRLAAAHDLAWAYTLRRLVDKDGAYICDDDWTSIGSYRDPRGPAEMLPTYIVDNSCFSVSRRLAQLKSLAWTAGPIVADRAFYLALMESGQRGGCTGLATVNYRLGTGTAQATPEQVLAMAAAAKAKEPHGGFPWRKFEVFGGAKA